MSNMTFLAGIARLGKVSWEDSTIKALLERDTSTWVPNSRQATLSACTGLVEVSASGYSRATLADPTSTADEDPEVDRVNYSTGNGNFGTPASGQSFIGILYYIHIDGTAANDIPLYYQDTGLGVDLPAPCQNGTVTVTITDLMRLIANQT